MKSVFTTIFSLLLVMVLYAQQRTVTGSVRDDKGDPVAYATITETGTNNIVQADSAGVFSIRVSETARLTISASGFAQLTLSANNAATVVLQRSASSQLSEVVVTALGQTRQAKELGYSTAKVRGTELTQAKVINLQNGLTGKVSGLNVQTVNNGVFADTRITLRGIRSLTGNNQPMLVVDGVPMALGYLNSINPNDIADVTILKSASSTAIYGPEGANGAVIVTTRKGVKGKPQVTVSLTTQMESVSFMPKLQTRFGSGSSVDEFGYGVYDPVENQTYGPEFNGGRVQIGRVGPNGDTLFTTYSAKPGEKRKFWDKGITTQADVSFSTGDFYFSAQNVSIHGIVPKDENHRRSFRMSANKEYGRFKTTFNLNYTNSNYDVHAGERFDNGRDYQVYWALINTPMHIPVTQFKDWKNDFRSSPNGYFSDYYMNPYYVIDNFRAKGKTNDFLGNVQLDYKLNSWFNITYRLGGTVTSAIDKATQNAFVYSDYAKFAGRGRNGGTKDINAALIESSATASRLTSELFGTFNKSFKDLSLNGLIGYSYRRSTNNSVGVSASNLGIPSVFNVLVRKGEPGTTEMQEETRLQRFFGRAGVGYKNWLFAEVTGNYDMDSRLANPYNFQPQDISYFYPGASVSVVLSEAVNAIRNSVTISYLKVRGAISKTGNVNLGAYSLENSYSPGRGFPYGTLIGFTSDNTLRRDSYKPEFIINKEAGIEIAFLQNRINIEATAYQQENKNQIITVAYSASTGFPNALLNAASFVNKGLEFDLKLTPLVRIGKANINFKVNYTYQANKVNEVIDGVDELGIGNGNFIIKGMPAYTFRLTDYKRDSSGRVIVDRNTGLPSVDPVAKTFGQTMPKHIIGLNLNVDWKGFYLTAVADHRSGNQIYNGLGPNMDFTGISYRSAATGRQPFVFPNSVYDDGNGKYVENTSVYTPGNYNFFSQTAVNTAAQSNYLSSGAFWKLREIAIGYNFPTRWLGKTAIKAASFTLTGRNLLTWVPSSNEWTDPEFSNTTGNAQGVNGLGNTPPTRIYGANLSLTF
jgi:TonB-linked SusC/RagA family outer membrane protein